MSAESSHSLLRPSASTAVKTDMRSFEGAVNEKWCHITPVHDNGEEDARYACGLPVDEPTHADCEDINGRCAICKRLCCPDCDRIWDERYA